MSWKQAHSSPQRTPAMQILQGGLPSHLWLRPLLHGELWSVPYFKKNAWEWVLVSSYALPSTRFINRDRRLEQQHQSWHLSFSLLVRSVTKHHFVDLSLSYNLLIILGKQPGALVGMSFLSSLKAFCESRPTDPAVYWPAEDTLTLGHSSIVCLQTLSRRHWRP